VPINHKGGQRVLYGKVTRYFHDRGFGFIRGDDGNTYFIHHSNLEGEYIDSGYFVSYKPFRNDRSDYNAKNVMVIEAPDRRRKHGKTHK
jgi:cold shock CspA family protein